MLLLVSALDLMVAYICMELQALCFFVMACTKRYTTLSLEAGVKYFILSAYASALILFGFSWTFG